MAAEVHSCSKTLLCASELAVVAGWGRRVSQLALLQRQAAPADMMANSVAAQ